MVTEHYSNMIIDEIICIDKWMRLVVTLISATSTFSFWKNCERIVIGAMASIMRYVIEMNLSVAIYTINQ